MLQTIEATIDENGAVHLLEPLHLDRRHRAFLTILNDEADETDSEKVTELSPAWKQEIKKRVADFRAGIGKETPIEEVFARIEAKLASGAYRSAQ